MKVFLTGGSGYTGSIVLGHLIERGHNVVALTRAAPSSSVRGMERVEWVLGDFSNGSRISEIVHVADAAIHIGASHDSEMERLDRTVVDSIAEGLAGTGRAFISTSATPVYGDTGAQPRDEREPIDNPHPLRAWRARHDLDVVALASRGIRGVVLRPPHIYGRGGGLLSDSIREAQATGQARYIGEGLNWTSTVHVDALARLYLLALEQERAHGIYNAASDEIVRGADTAQAIAAGFGPGIAPTSWPLEKAREALGELADLAVITCVVNSDRARSHLGWSPTAPSLINEVVAGSYRGTLLPYHNR